MRVVTLRPDILGHSTPGTAEHNSKESGFLQARGGPRTIGTENDVGDDMIGARSPLSRFVSGRTNAGCSECRTGEAALDLRAAGFSIDADC